MNNEYEPKTLNTEELVETVGGFLSLHIGGVLNREALADYIKFHHGKDLIVNYPISMDSVVRVTKGNKQVTLNWR